MPRDGLSALVPGAERQGATVGHRWVGAVLVLLALPLLAARPPPRISPDGLPVDRAPWLAVRIYKPAIAGPAPTLVFKHGSTGRGNDPSLFARPIDFPPLAQFFVECGWRW
jgi:hypothetical protein